MLVKRYHAKNMRQAMDIIMKELGPEAVVLNSRRVRKKGLRHIFSKKFYEVMVAYDPAKLPLSKKFGLDSPAPPPPEKARGQAEASSAKIDELESRISGLDKTITSFIDSFSIAKREMLHNYTPEVEAFFCALAGQQVREELAHSLARQTEQVLRNRPEADAREVMEHLIMEILGAPDPVRPKRFKQYVVLFVGPTGVGKTTTLVKLAANFSVIHKKKTGIINTDTYRIAAQTQLQTYADILGIPLAVAYKPEEVAEALEGMGSCEVIFIDTAGKKPGDEQHREDLEKLMEIARPDEILLCISATTGFASMREIVDTYGFIENYKFIMTKTDETKFRGAILNAAWYTRKNCAYLATGQSVPDDIETADMEALTRALMRKSDGTEQ